MSLDAAVDLAGVDGCKRGWIAVTKRRRDAPEAKVWRRFADLVASLGDDAVIAVDMPIGLPERSGKGGRGPEGIIRTFLGKRRPSVFSIPSRGAVYAVVQKEMQGPLPGWYEQHRVACAAALATSEPRRSISIQAFGIFPKIRELDTLLRGDPALSERIIESHPEAAFRHLDHGEPMRHPKRLDGKVNPFGMAERRHVLADHGFEAGFLSQPISAGAGEDDFLDACAMLAVAARRARGEAVSYPDPPGRDGAGLPIAIWC